jgi:hypothetical protein
MLDYISASDEFRNQTEVREHLLIAGTGRSGTSFLVRYMTELGMDTVLARQGEAAEWDEDANAGFEGMPLVDPDQVPYVIKNPWGFEFIDELLQHPTVRLRTAIVPVRDLRDAASSRMILERRAIHAKAAWMAERDMPWESWGYTSGGAIFSLNPVDQARLLAVGFHHLMEKLITSDVPVIMLAFPRLVEDADYLFRALRSVLPEGTTIAQARVAHARTANATKVRVRAAPEARTSLRGPSSAELDRQGLQREVLRLRRLIDADTPWNALKRVIKRRLRSRRLGSLAGR